MEHSNKNKVLAGIVVIVAVALMAIAASMLSKEELDDNANSQVFSDQASSNSIDKPTQLQDSIATYKDGTYTVSDTYPSPGGEEDIKVVLTLEDQIVASVDVIQEANQRESAEYQALFQAGYKSRVIGRAIDTLQLNHVSGSSLTTQAFDEALEQIRNQAKA